MKVRILNVFYSFFNVCSNPDDHDDEAHAHPHEHGHHHHVHGKNDPFCCMMGLKLGFFAGFAFGQIFFGVLADRIGRHLTLKLVTKTLIIASLIASNTGRCEEPNKYVFGTFYFIVGAASAASFLIVFTIVLEEIDEGEEVCDAPDGSHWWSSRLFVGILMTVAWNLARIFGTVLCRLCSDWELVLNITAISICVVYFTFDHIISKMPEERVVQARNVEAKKGKKTKTLNKIVQPESICLFFRLFKSAGHDQGQPLILSQHGGLESDLVHHGISLLRNHHVVVSDLREPQNVHAHGLVGSGRHFRRHSRPGHVSRSEAETLACHVAASRDGWLLLLSNVHPV